ncbi:flavin reductase like domain-containing protein [Aspergillus californicus]
MKLKLPNSRAKALFSLSTSRNTRIRGETRYTHPRYNYTTATNVNGPSKNPRNDASQSSSSSLPNDVRLLMRRVPYPVAIITSTSDLPPSTESNSTPSQLPNPKAGFRGMTVSSFNTVTLTPTPVISFNVRRPSETLNALLTSGRFLVHLLAPITETAHLARDFARGNQNLTQVLGEEGAEERFEFVGYTPTVSTSSKSISGIDHDMNKKEKEKFSETSPLLPLLQRRNKIKNNTDAKHAEFFPFVFECRLLSDSVVDVYDHTIVVGTIVRAISRPDSFSSDLNAIDAAESDSSEDLCLTYANTRFWEIGKQIS